MRTACGAPWNIVYNLIIRTLPMPLRSDSDRNRKIGRIARNRRIALVHHLIAVVAEHLTEVIELGPADMTRRARQSVLSSERRNGIGRLRRREHHSQQ